MFTAITTIILTALIGGIGWILRNEIEKRREVEKQLSEKKYSVYIKIMNLFFDVIKNTKESKKISDEKIANEMFVIVKELIVFGSDSVNLKFIEWRESANKGNPNLVVFLFADLIVEIRKDMGSPATKLSNSDVLKMFINDYETLLIKK